MSVTSRSDTHASSASGDVPEDRLARSRPGATSRLHRPVRAVIALAELLLACVAVWLAFEVWSNGITTFANGTTRYHGDLITGAIALGGFASLLVLDALRQLMLAVRTKHKRKADTAEDPWPDYDEDYS